MISIKDFTAIDNEVESSIEAVFDYLKKYCVDHNYVLFLADAEYHESLKNSQLHLNPFTIDNAEDKYKDESRQDFFIKFMQTFYSFPNNQKETEDNNYRMTMELMIYTHIWESKPFLKQLYRLASLCQLKSYQWHVEIPEMSKHDFIRFQIRDIFKLKNLSLANIITKGFHTSLRNAFAHSEYRFDEYNKRIHLDTYKGAAWDIKSITYDEWTIRFVYTALLSYHFFNERVRRRKSLVKDFGRDTFLIIHPITEKRSRVQKIYYNERWDRFSFYKRMD